MNVLMVIAPQNFRDEELRGPKAALERAGHRVTIASTHAGTCVSTSGRTIEASLALIDAHAEDYAAVVFVGGDGATCFFSDPVAHRLARAVRARGGVVGAICIAPTILARAGLLNGLEATAFPSEKDELLRAGAHFVAQPVAAAGKVFTANGPGSADLFGWRLATALQQ